MSKVNIPQSKNDFHYRYKRDIIKTNNLKNKLQISNTEKISKEIYRTPEQIAKFLKIQTASNVTVENGLITFNTQTKTAKELDDFLEKFIVEKVLCKNCENPETIYEIIQEKKSKKGKVYCKACGFSQDLNNEDKYDSSLLK